VTRASFVLSFRKVDPAIICEKSLVSNADWDRAWASVMTVVSAIETVTENSLKG